METIYLRVYKSYYSFFPDIVNTYSFIWIHFGVMVKLPIASNILLLLLLQSFLDWREGSTCSLKELRFLGQK